MQAEKDRKHDVDAVEEQLQQHRERALAAPEHVAEDGVVDERERRRQHADADIGRHRLVDAAVGIEEPLAKQHEERRERGKHDAGRHGDREGAPEDRLLLGLVAAAERLRDQTGGAGADEVEGGEDDVEHQRAGGEAADQRRVAELADDGGIDQAEQRRGQIGERHRHGDRQHRAMRDRERPRCRWL